MTEQEAFNDPEMKVIILLSGYVREIGEGKDYETTTYKLAETIVKIFSMHNVSGSLLVAEYIGKFNLYKYEDKWYTDNEGLICNTDEELIDIINKWSEQ